MSPRLLLPVVLALGAGCLPSTEDSSVTSDEAELTVQLPRGLYRILSPQDVPFNSLELGISRLQLNANGTFEREVGSRECYTPACPPKRTQATGRYTFTTSGNPFFGNVQRIRFFDNKGVFLDSWGALLSGEQLRVFLDTEGSSGLTYATAGGTHVLGHTYPERLLTEADKGRTVTIEVGQSLGIQLPIAPGGRWEFLRRSKSDLTIMNDIFILPHRPTGPVPQGMVRTVFVAAHHSMGSHSVALQYIGQDGVRDPKKIFQANVNIVGGESIKDITCPAKGCVWLGLNEDSSGTAKVYRVEEGQPIFVTLASTSLYPASCDNGAVGFPLPPVSVWLGDEPLPGKGTTSSRFQWQVGIKSFTPGKQEIRCVDRYGNRPKFSLDVVPAP